MYETTSRIVFLRTSSPLTGRVRLAYARVQELQVVVYFRDSTNGRTRIAAGHFLLDSYSRRNTFYLFDVGFLHSSHKLSCVGAEALYVASLPFGIERVERQRTLAAAADACDHHEFVTWYIYRNMFKIVGVGSFYMDELFVQLSHCFSCFSFEVFQIDACLFGRKVQLFGR